MVGVARLMARILIPYVIEVRGGRCRGRCIRAIWRSGVGAGEGSGRGEGGCGAGVVCVLLLGRLAAVFRSRQLLMLDYQ